MNVNFKSGSIYYPGIQRFYITRDSTFRKALVVFALLAAIQIPVAVMFKPGPLREVAYVLMFLVYVVPAAVVLAGGACGEFWKWYTAGATFFAISTTAFALGAPGHVLLLILASLPCFYMCHVKASHVLFSLGYTGRLNPLYEIVFILVISGSLISYTALGQVLIRRTEIHIPTLSQYIWYGTTSALYYGTLWGIIHGIIMKRFLDMRYEIAVPVIVSTMIMIIYWMPPILSYTMKLEMAISGVVLMSLSSQIILGMAFYYCRTTRPLVIGYVIYYMFLKSIVF